MLNVLEVTGLAKIYPALSAELHSVTLFRDMSLSVAAGEMVAIVGASGAGKSSLLHLLAALDTPTAGSIVCDGTHVATLTGAQAAVYRNRSVGYVWQFHHLLPEFTALENIAMPLLSRGVKRGAALAEAGLWLERVGLAERGEHRSGELSGGEQQRVSLARALITKPVLLLADEPTGDLDNENAEAVFALLQELQREQGLAAVLVTHNLAFARRCDRVLRLQEGRLVVAS